MTGIIVTGHGSFASGITSGLKLLAGEPENYAAVDFMPEDSVETLAEKLGQAAKGLDGREGILILADIAGGSPFNVSLRMKLTEMEHYEVVGGTNLPAVLEAYMTRQMHGDVLLLARSVCEAARSHVVLYEPPAVGESPSHAGSAECGDDDGFEE